MPHPMPLPGRRLQGKVAVPHPCRSASITTRVSWLKVGIFLFFWLVLLFFLNGSQVQNVARHVVDLDIVD